MEDKVEIPVPQAKKATIPFWNLILRKLQGTKIIWLLLLIIVIMVVGIILVPDRKVNKKNINQQPTPISSDSSKNVSGRTSLIKGAVPDGSIEDDRVFKSLAISYQNPNIVYLGTEGNGIFRSTDGGKTWQWERQGLRHTDWEGMTNKYAEVYDLKIDPRDDKIVYAGMTASPEEANELSIGGVFKTTDGGQTWQQSIKGFLSSSVNSLAIDQVNTDILYAGTQGKDESTRDVLGSTGKKFAGGVFKSIDAGKNWQALTFPENWQNNKLNQMEVRGQTIFVIGNYWVRPSSMNEPIRQNLSKSAGLIKSPDGGKTWQQITPSGYAPTHFDVSSDGSILYLVGEDFDGYKSTDGGNSWTKKRMSDFVRISPKNPQIVFYDKDGNKVYRSEDGGSSAKIAIDVPEGRQINDIEFAPSDNNIVYAATTGYQVYKSTDGGNTFSLVANLREWLNKQP